MLDWTTELVGLFASLLVLLSMFCKTNTFKGALAMRSVNLAGSFVFIAYGVMLPALTTILFNVVAIVVNIYHISKLKEQYGGNSDE